MRLYLDLFGFSCDRKSLLSPHCDRIERSSTTMRLQRLTLTDGYVAMHCQLASVKQIYSVAHLSGSFEPPYTDVDNKLHIVLADELPADNLSTVKKRRTKCSDFAVSRWTMLRNADR